MLDFSNVNSDCRRCHVDKYYFGKVDRISPKLRSPSSTFKRRIPVGGASNVANNIVSLEDIVYYVVLSAMIFSVKKSNGSAATKISTPFC